MLTYIVMTTAVKLLRISSRLFVSSLLVLPFVGVISFISPSTAHANPAVVINELMYNPASDNQDEEYLELYNTSGAPIDVSDWCFTAGISGCFTSGTTIASNGYLMVSPSSSQSQTTYSLTPDLVYSGNLSNGGETITLTDNNAIQVDTLTYDDASPWPTTPDGNGPSLELKNPAADNSQAAAWAASLSSGGTPNAQNSVYGIELPEISKVSRHTFVAPITAVTVTAEIEDSTDVELVYKVMFDAEVTITMHDDGNHNDGDPGDGIYGAQIPGQTAGTLVRYKIQATNPDGTASSPGTDDTLNYYPYIVEDGQTADIPIVRWYMDLTDYTDMTTNHLTDDQQFSAVVAVGEQIFDNALVRVKGQSSTSFSKRKYKFDLPSGHVLQAPIFEHPVDEFAIQTYFLNQSDIQEGMSWRAFEQFGFDRLQNRYVRAQRNSDSASSEFIGHYLLIENYDNLWRQRNDRESGALYKQGNDKKTRTDEDNSDIQSLVDNVTTLEGQELKDYLLDNLNIPAVVNYHAVSAAILHSDWFFGKNIYQYRDTEGSSRWEYMPWDLDNAFVSPTLGDPLDIAKSFKYPIAGEYKMEMTGESVFYDEAIIERAIYQFPEFRQMFYRRSMNVYDQIWANDKYLEWYDEFFSTSEETMSEDLELWNPSKKSLYEAIFPGGLPWSVPDDFPYDLDPVNYFDNLDGQTPAMARELYIYGANRLKGAVAELRSEGQLLGLQGINEERRIQITEINAWPESGNEDLEFVEIYNNSDKAVDLSGWELRGVDFHFPEGSVLQPGGHGVVVKNDPVFRNRYPSVLVFGEYGGDLAGEGESLTLLNKNNAVMSQVAYRSGDGWPDLDDEQGYTLNLLRTNANEALGACWASSSQIGGTPGQPNSINDDWDQSIASCTDRIYSASSTNEDGGVNLNRQLASTGANVWQSLVLAIVLISSSILIRHFRAPRAKITIRIKK